jgi:hypothetical protein
MEVCMRKLMTAILCMMLVISHLSCAEINGIDTRISVDSCPPHIETVFPASRTEIQLIASEPVTAKLEDFSIPSIPGVDSLQTKKNVITISTGEALEAGRSYTLSGFICDAAGNQSHVTLDFYGWNPDPPEMVINEFTPRGSSAHPDTVELLVISDGNTAGITLYDGTPRAYRQRSILPYLEVKASDFLVVHCRLENSEQTPLGSEYQFRMDGDMGLSGNNGVLTLCSSPQGDIIDGVIYSNRFSDSDTRYGGFASSMTWDNARLLWDSGQWSDPDGNQSSEHPSPEQAVRSDHMSATRSANRRNPAEDTDSATDWFIVPTSGSTFGYENTNETYEP